MRKYNTAHETSNEFLLLDSTRNATLQVSIVEHVGQALALWWQRAVSRGGEVTVCLLGVGRQAGVMQQQG